jgi:hypothetical protein
MDRPASAPAAALGYHDVLPFAWRPAAAQEPLSGWAEQNLRVLTAIAALGERSLIDAEAPGAAEFERLHRKVDLLIELLGALLRRTQDEVLMVPLRLSAEGLAWPAGAELPPIGSRISVRVDLHACAPMPWQWTGEIVAHHNDNLHLRFAPMPEALASALERHVFTQHRRSVADARSPTSRGTAAGAA